MRPHDRPHQLPSNIRRQRTPNVRWRIALTLALLAASTPVVARLPPQLPHLPEHHLESRLLTLTNEERTAAGAPPVEHDAALAQAARHHAEEMARLGYFSHVSPTPGRGSPSERVRLAGGTHAMLGENLAEAGARDLDVAERIVAGWMASPGHRTTLLNTAWTHVGFGIAEHDRGRAYVVQVFASDPNPIRSIDATRTDERSLALRVEVAVATTGHIALVTNEIGAVPHPAQAGTTQSLVVDGLAADAPTHVRLGWTASEATGFIAQQSGWFDPASGAWTEDWSNPVRDAEVVGYSSTDPIGSVTLHVAFEREPSDLILLVDGSEPTTSTSGTTIEARLPGRDGVREVVVGAMESDGRVLVLHAFEVSIDADGVRLR